MFSVFLYLQVQLKELPCAAARLRQLLFWFDHCIPLVHLSTWVVTLLHEPFVESSRGSPTHSAHVWSTIVRKPVQSTDGKPTLEWVHVRAKREWWYQQCWDVKKKKGWKKGENWNRDTGLWYTVLYPTKCFPLRFYMYLDTCHCAQHNVNTFTNVCFKNLHAVSSLLVYSTCRSQHLIVTYRHCAFYLPVQHNMCVFRLTETIKRMFSVFVYIHYITK